MSTASKTTTEVQEKVLVDESPESHGELESAATVAGSTTLSKRAQKRKLRQEKWNAVKHEIREKKRQKRRAENGGQVNFNQQCLQETTYYFENGLRKVYPYHYAFTTHAKGRWVNQRIIDVFTKEFRHDTPENYLKAIAAGKVTVNGHPVEATYVLKDNDYVENMVHRHELPVTGERIPVLHEDSDVVVVDKPSSIPIHPCGRYRHNSLTFILDKDYGYKNLRTLYRLDRLTSGVMIFAKSEKVARRMHDSIKDRLVSKEYLCRVDGEFPSGEVSVNESLDVLSRKLGLYKVCPTGKEASTRMDRLSYDGKSSVVRCRPLTGRTHQIRVHLQWLGFPIVNDPLYNSQVWGPQRGKNGEWGKSEEQLIADLLAAHTPENHIAQPVATDVTAENPTSSQTQPEATTTSNTDTHMDISEPTVQSSSSGQDVIISSNTESSENKTESDQSHEMDDNSSRTDNPSESLNKSCSKADNPSKFVNKSSSPVNKPSEFINKSESMAGHPSDPVTKSIASSTSAACSRSSDSVSGTDDDLPLFDPAKLVVDTTCSFCGVKYEDPKPHNLVMYLHAHSYKGPGWAYTTSIPDWAKEDWKEPELS